MQLDINEEETRALLNLLMETIENDRYPFSPRIQLLRAILAKFGEMGPKRRRPPDRRQRRSAIRGDDLAHNERDND
jgi:hypothetical protein